MVPQTYESTLIPGGARITGRVSDASGGGVARALVKAYDADGTAIWANQYTREVKDIKCLS